MQQAFGQEPQSALTIPILPGTDGVRRMGKSLGNYVGVTDPPEEMFGKLMSIPDEVIGQYALLLLGEELDEGRPPNEAKRDLARRLVARLHGEGAGTAARSALRPGARAGRVPDDVATGEADVGEGGTVHLPALLAAEFGISSSEARRLIGKGAVKVAGEALAGDRLDVPLAELAGKVLQVGKRRFFSRDCLRGPVAAAGLGEGPRHCHAPVDSAKFAGVDSRGR